MALTPVKTIHPAQLALESSNVQFMRLKRRIARLQKFADEHGEKWIAGIPMSIQSYEDAAGASKEYDGPWFRSLPYSQEIKAKIASALLEACRPYPLVNTSVWAKIASRS